MPTGEAATTTEPAPRAPRPIPAVDQLARAAELVFEGKRPMDLARKLRVPYPVAARLYEQVYEEVIGRLEAGYSPAVLATMKAEMTETLLEVVRNCKRAVAHSFREGKPNTRSYTHSNAAIKLINAMSGFNAPTASVNLDVRAYSIVPADQQHAFLNDPEYRRHVLALEDRERELLAQGAGHVAGPVRGTGEQGQVVLRPAFEVVERPDDAGGDRRDPPPGDVHAAEARQEPLPLDVLPGVVPGHLPRPEGDLGQL